MLFELMTLNSMYYWKYSDRRHLMQEMKVYPEEMIDIVLLMMHLDPTKRPTARDLCEYFKKEKVVPDFYDPFAIERGKIAIVKNKILKHYRHPNDCVLKLATFDGMIETLTSNGDIYDHEIIVVKLIFSELSDTSWVGSWAKYGNVHTSLSFENQIIDWNNSSLCIPREFEAKKAILAMDIARVPKEHAHKLLKELCHTIVEWNTSVFYNLISANCQTFTDAILRRLDLPVNLPTSETWGPVRQMKKVGKIDYLYKVPIHMNNDIIARTLSANNTIHFASHEALDNVVTYIRTLIPDYFSYNPEEYELLKAYDRAFWLRYLKAEKLLRS